MPTDPTPAVSAIYVSWNTRDDLRSSVERLLGATMAEGVEIIVVDNASSDGTPDMVRERLPGVRLIANEGNRGFAVAVNQGFRVSRGRYCLLLNPDTIIAPETLRLLVEFMGRCPRIGACSPLLVNEDGASTVNAVPFPPITRRLDRALRDHPHGEPLPVPAGPWGRATRAHWLAGACLLVRREAFEATKGLDEGYFLYWEDVDWCYRALHQGWEVALLPELTAVHLAAHSAGQVPQRLTWWRRHDGYFRFLANAHGPWVARANFLQWLATAGVKSAVLGLLSRVSPRRRWIYEFEASRFTFCLAGLGRPFWCCDFGRNHESARRR
jgi:GT2 family glycosyltransferase